MESQKRQLLRRGRHTGRRRKMENKEKINIDDILEKFAYIADDMEKIPSALDKIPKEMDPIFFMQCVAAYYAGCFMRIIRDIYDEGSQIDDSAV